MCASYAVTTAPLDLERLVSAVTGLDSSDKTQQTSGFGAITSFVGIVRNENAGRRVLRLEYESYEALALRAFALITEETTARWAVRVALHHRLGTLQIGEASVMIAAASPHRTDRVAEHKTRHDIGAARDRCETKITLNVVVYEIIAFGDQRRAGGHHYAKIGEVMRLDGLETRLLDCIDVFG